MRFLIRVALLAVIPAGLSLQASNLTLGNPPMVGTGNCDPFGCPGFIGLGTYQQVYLSSAFPSEISIQGLTFFDTQVANGGTPAAGNYTISLSYTSFDPGDLSLSSPATNITGGSQTFFSGTLPSLTSVTGGSVLVIPGTAFDYNPADGNLLMTVTVTGAGSVGPALYLNEALCGPKTFCPAGTTDVSGSVYFGTVAGGNAEGGLVTEFAYSGVEGTPEPASVLTVLAGLAVIGYHSRRKRNRIA